MKIQFFK